MHACLSICKLFAILTFKQVTTSVHLQVAGTSELTGIHKRLTNRVFADRDLPGVCVCMCVCCVCVCVCVFVFVCVCVCVYVCVVCVSVCAHFVSLAQVSCHSGSCGLCLVVSKGIPCSNLDVHPSNLDYCFFCSPMQHFFCQMST